ARECHAGRRGSTGVRGGRHETCDLSGKWRGQARGTEQLLAADHRHVHPGVQMITRIRACTLLVSFVALVAGLAVVAGHAVAATPRAVVTWTAPRAVDPLVGLPVAVGCAADVCAMVDGSGHAVTRKGAAWSAPKLMDTVAAPTSVSCGSSTFCVAV